MTNICFSEAIPKFQVYNNALKTVLNPLTFEQALLDRKAWGHLFESVVGAYIVSQSFAHRFDVYYWRERIDDVDFILKKKGAVVAIEVKSNSEKKTAGLLKFREMFHPKETLVVGEGGFPVEEFLAMDLRKLF